MDKHLVSGLDALEQWLKEQEYSKLYFLFDDNTEVHCQPLLPNSLMEGAHILSVQHGESHKTIETCTTLWQNLMDLGADRKSILVNIGGGMLTDLGGFAAATYKRGIRFVNVPTTLLAMVDASIGNKTGVNFQEIKNQIGTFSPAERIVIDPRFLGTLSPREWLSGLGEVLKYGLIIRKELWREALSTADGTMPSALIEECIRIKLDVVAQDPKEHGLRQILNYGHTIGHGLEAYAHHIGQPISHGAAVALGMLAEAYLSQQILGFEELDEVKDGILSKYQLPEWMRNFDDIETILAFIRQDKKNVNGQVRCSLLSQIGKASVGHPLSEAQLSEAITWLSLQA